MVTLRGLLPLSICVNRVARRRRRATSAVTAAWSPMSRKLECHANSKPPHPTARQGCRSLSGPVLQDGPRHGRNAPSKSQQDAPMRTQKMQRWWIHSDTAVPATAQWRTQPRQHWRAQWPQQSLFSRSGCINDFVAVCATVWGIAQVAVTCMSAPPDGLLRSSAPPHAGARSRRRQSCSKPRPAGRSGICRYYVFT